MKLPRTRNKIHNNLHHDFAHCFTVPVCLGVYIPLNALSVNTYIHTYMIQKTSQIIILFLKHKRKRNSRGEIFKSQTNHPRTKSKVHNKKQYKNESKMVLSNVWMYIYPCKSWLSHMYQFIVISFKHFVCLSNLKYWGTLQR